MSTKARLSRAQKCMNILGWFHYMCFLLLVVLIILILLIGTGRFGAELQKNNPAQFAFLKSYESDVAGISVVIISLISAMIELFLGWSCRRKARRPEKILLTLILSGIQSLYTIFSMLRTGLANVSWLEMGYTLALNLTTFSLALWMWLEYKRNPPASR